MATGTFSLREFNSETSGHDKVVARGWVAAIEEAEHLAGREIELSDTILVDDEARTIRLVEDDGWTLVYCTSDQELTAQLAAAGLTPSPLPRDARIEVSGQGRSKQRFICEHRLTAK